MVFVLSMIGAGILYAQVQDTPTCFYHITKHRSLKHEPVCPGRFRPLEWITHPERQNSNPPIKRYP
jgi:hypothetical protein